MLPLYPYAPKSARSLRPGEFWAIRLSDDSYSCGVVVSPAPSSAKATRVLFLAGLLDWRSPKPPTPAAIAGSECFAQAKFHYEGIGAFGGKILGVRPAASAPLEPWTFRSARVAEGSYIQKGLELVRPQTDSDDQLSVISVWRYDFPRLLAEKRFQIGVPPNKSLERTREG
jgi:hypothetical protein